jgi:DNA-binding NtrC family response regulator
MPKTADPEKVKKNNGARILIVDDEEGARRSLALILGRYGYTVETAQSGQEALAIAAETSLNLAFVDIQLTDMDGTDLIKPLLESNPGLVVIMVSGHAAADTAAQSLDLGAARYITKPIDMVRLLAEMENTLE